MVKVRAIAALVCIIFLSSLVLIPFANAGWAMFRSDPSHSGAGTGSPVLTPKLLWNYTAGGEIGSSPAVVSGVVYIGSYDGKVYALNANNGIQLWNYTIGSNVESSPAVVNGVVYIGSEVSAVLNGNYFGSVYALNATNGDKLWNYTTGNYYNYVDSSPAVEGGVVYIGSSEGITPEPPTFASLGSVYALNATDGAKLWNYTTGFTLSSPAVVNGVVYIGSYDDNVYAFGGSSRSSNTSLIIIEVAVAVLVIATVVFLTFRKRLKTKPQSPLTTPAANARTCSKRNC